METPSDPAYLDRLLGERERLRGLALRLVGDVGQADDVVQETLVIALETRPPGRVSLRAWLAGVARNVARHLHRGESRRAQRERRSSGPLPSEGSDELAARVEGQKHLAEAVLSLEEPFRTAVMLRYFEELEPKDIAARLGVPPSTVRGRLERGLAKLRERLAAEYGSDRGFAMALLPLAIPGSLAPPVGLALSGSASAAKTGAAAAPSGAFIMGTSAQLSLSLAGLAALAMGALLFMDTSDPTSAPVAPDLDGALLAPADSTDAVALSGEGGAGRRPVPVELSVEAHASLETPEDRPAALAPLELSLLTCCIVGQVTGASGEPLGGVPVVGLDDRPAGGFVDPDQPRAVLGSTVTEQDGMYRLSVPASHPVRLSIEHEPFAPSSEPACFAGTRHDFRLESGATLAVSVVDDLGNPLASAQLELKPYFRSKIPKNWRRFGVTNAAGTAELTRLPSGALELTIEAEGFADLEYRFQAEASKIVSERLQLEREIVAVGRVLDRETGLPIAGAVVGREFGRGVTTNLDGEFTVPGFSPTSEFSFGVFASAPGYAEDTRYFNASSLVERPIIFELSAAGSIRGVLVDDRGEPIFGGRVARDTHFQCVPMMYEHQRAVTTTDREGRFLFEDVPPRSESWILAKAADLGVTTVPCEVGSADVDLGTIALTAAGSIVGRVEVAPGSEVSPHRVRIEPAGILVPSYVALERTLVAPNGEFAFSDLSAGRYRVSLDPWDKDSHQHLDEPLAVREVELPAGDLVDIGTLGLHPNLSGQVINEEGAPIGSVRIEAFGTGGNLIGRTHVGEGGDFSLALPGDGPYRVVAEDRRLYYGRVELEGIAVGENLSLVLPPASSPYSIAGFLRTEAGVPIKGEFVHFTYMGTGDRITGQLLFRGGISDAQGRFELKNLQPGLYDLRLNNFSGQYEPAVLSGVDASESPVVEMTLRPSK